MRIVILLMPYNIALRYKCMVLLIQSRIVNISYNYYILNFKITLYYVNWKRSRVACKILA